MVGKAQPGWIHLVWDSAFMARAWGMGLLCHHCSRGSILTRASVVAAGQRMGFKLDLGHILPIVGKVPLGR